MVFDGKRWQPRPEADLQNRPEKYVAAFPGVDGAMVFEDDRNRFHLFDAEGHAVADSAEELALKHGDRLRKALRYPPQDNIDYGHQLLKDAAGRIWWARWPAGWGVVDGTTAIRGEMDDVMKRDRVNPFSLLYPIGDGTRVLLGPYGDIGPSGVYGVEKGRIARLADPPVSGIALPWVHPPTTIARTDSSGRAWVMRFDDKLGPISQAIDSRGKLAATHRGWLVFEDRKKGLWFRQALWSKYTKAFGPDCIMRLDADGRDAALDVPDLTAASPLAEAPDGSAWTLTDSELIRIRAGDGRLSIVERYAMHVKDSDRLWCDSDGRVWMVHETTSSEGPPYTELIRFATKTSLE